MDRWPRIDDAELRARMALGHEQFLALLARFADALPPRAFTQEIYEQALGYPWARPARSYVLTEQALAPLDDLPAQERHRLLGDAAQERWPLLAFGANGAPERLALKLAHLPGAQRRVLVVTGNLHDFDVGASAHPTVYGALPATIFPSEGTVLRASLLWVTIEQLTALAWTELSYALGRLDGIRFEADLPEAPASESVLAFVSRLGAHRVDGKVIALQALPSPGRTAPAYTQERLLGQVAALALGNGATARDLVRGLMEDFGGAAAAIGPRLHAGAQPFVSDHWTPHPSTGSAFLGAKTDP